MIHYKNVDGQVLQFAEVHAQVVRDGRIEADLVLDRYESLTSKAKRFVKRALPWIGIGLLAYGALSGKPEMVPAATVITNTGKAVAANRMIGSGTTPSFVAWGTGAGTAAATDTTLFTESTEESRTSGTATRVTTTVTNDTMQVVGTITVATSNKTITNVGLFDASTSGNLYFKSDFTGLALLVNDSITFTIKVAHA